MTSDQVAEAQQDSQRELSNIKTKSTEKMLKKMEASGVHIDKDVQEKFLKDAARH
jgi:hypothetical protein